MLSAVITERMYSLIKLYVDLIQSRDNLVKSFDDRILDLLAAEIKLSSFRCVLGYIKRYIKQAMNQLTIKNLKQEYEEVMH